MVRIGPKSATLMGHLPPADLLGAQLQRLVRQAVRRVATNDQCDALLEEALGAAQMDRVPDDLGQFAEFLFGPLRDVVAKQIGPEQGDVVVQSLSDVVSAKVDTELIIRDEEGRDVTPEPLTEDGPATVLVVENDLLVRAQLAKLLRDQGYRAVSAPDGNLALAMCVRYRPQLVITSLAPGDLQAERFSGLMQVAFGTDAPPLVLLSEDPQAAPAGASAITVVAKPVDHDALLAAVERLLA